MFATNYDFSKVTEIYIQGIMDIDAMTTLSLLPFLTKASFKGIKEIPSDKIGDPSILFLSSSEDVMNKSVGIAKEINKATNVLPLKAWDFLVVIIKDQNDLHFLAENINPFLNTLTTNALTIGMQSVLKEGVEFIHNLLGKLLWSPLLASLNTESLFTTFVKENPPLEITPGFYLLAKLPLPSHLERYFDLQAKILEPLVTLESPLFMLYLKDDKWFVDKLVHDNTPERLMKSYSYEKSMNITDLIIAIRANEVENAFIEEASNNTCINPSPKKGE